MLVEVKLNCDFVAISKIIGGGINVGTLIDP
jgi:glutamate-1-semialdehyde aminotransferase